MPRRLKPEELDLWRKVADSTERMHPDRTKPYGEAKPPAPARQTARKPPIPEFRAGERAPDPPPIRDLAPSLTERMNAVPLRMDRKAHGRMKRGKLVPEARIDLHGMTMNRAHPALTGFILRAHREGKRLVLVITGKGRDRDEDGPIPVRRGILRHQVPHWLTVPPLSALVLQIVPAHIRHGGGGAFYVYLRRNRQ